MNKFKAPSANLDAFTCAYCGAYAQQSTHEVRCINKLNVYRTRVLFDRISGSSELCLKQCQFCGKDHLFDSEYNILLYPKKSSAPPAQEDMPEEVLALYKEAASIVSDSPSAACLLIRKALEVLLADLTKETNLNKMITVITEDATKPWAKPLTPLLTSIRLIGNDAVHPREINRADNEQTALTLFSFLNICVDQLISQPLKTKQFLENNSIPV